MTTFRALYRITTVRNKNILASSFPIWLITTEIEVTVQAEYWSLKVVIRQLIEYGPVTPYLVIMCTQFYKSREIKRQLRRCKVQEKASAYVNDFGWT